MWQSDDFVLGHISYPFQRIEPTLYPKILLWKKNTYVYICAWHRCFSSIGRPQYIFSLAPFVLENIKVLKKRLPFITITLFLSSASLGLLTGKNTKINLKVDSQMRWTYLHNLHYLAYLHYQHYLHFFHYFHYFFYLNCLSSLPHLYHLHYLNCLHYLGKLSKTC